MLAPTDRFAPVRSETHLITLLALFYVFMSALMPQGGHPLDTATWALWIDYMQQHGIRHVYDMHTHPAPGEEPGFIYGPVYMYLLYGYGKWQGSIDVIRETIYQFKSVVLVFDVVGIWFALRYLRKPDARPFYALFLIFNVGLLYDTVGWGQADSIIACLMLIAMHYALRGQLAISALVIVIGLLIKPQPVIFLPAFGLIALPVILKSTVRRNLLSILAVVMGSAFLLSPFLLAGTAIDYWTMLSHSATLHPSVSIKAANIWPLLLTEDPYLLSDQVIRYGLSYRQWGLGMFALAYAVILFPLARQTYQLLTGKRAQYDTDLVLLTFGLIPIVFYFFNTQMHERYAHPAILFLAAYALYTTDFIPYVLASIANFAVMEKGISFTNSFRFYEQLTLGHLALLFLFVMGWGMVQLYRKPILEVKHLAIA